MAQAGTVTVLFTDLVGSTALRQSMGDDGADALRRQHDRVLREAITAHGGNEVKGTGDGLMVVFGSSADAVGAAVDMQRGVTRLNRRLAAPIGLRIGISAGDVVWEDGDCFGTPVVEARRLCDAADGGQILTGEVVRLLAGSRGGHRFEPAGQFDLKGLTDPVAASMVAWDADLVGAVPLPGPLISDDTLGFVGRAEERGRLEGAWKEAAAGKFRAVLVSGEPGVGKTRIAGEVARAAHRDGATVLFGRCDEDFSVPYQPFVEALDGYVAHTSPELLTEQTGRHGGDLARVLPRLAARVPNLPEPMRGEAELERHHLFEGVKTLIDNMAAENPVVLFIDDLHWAAKPTLLLLRHLLRSDGPRALLVLATYRDTDLGRGHPLSDLLASFRSEAGVERVDLQGLDQDEVAEVIAIAAGHEPDALTDELSRQLFAETEGNPFFLGQTLRHLVETRAIVREDGRWRRGPEADRVGIPEGVREVIGRRLSHLSDETNEVLNTAAVIGRDFDAELLVAASTLDSEAVFDALEVAEQARLIHALPGRRGHYNFVHALVRSTLYEEIATTRRLRIHRRVGLALEPRNLDERYVDELARHFGEAAALGEADRALDYGRRAAMLAIRRLAYEEAATKYEALIAALDPEDRDLALAAQLNIELGRARWSSGDRAAARVAFTAACIAARHIGDAETFATAAIGFGGGRGWSDAGVVDAELIALLEEALVLLPPTPSPLRAMVMARLASDLHFWREQTSRREQLAEDAIAMVRQFDDPAALTFALACAQFGMWVPGTREKRLAVSEELTAVAVASEDLVAEFNGRNWLITTSWENGDADRARVEIPRLVEVAERLGMADSDWMSHVVRTNLAIFEGRLDDAQELMDAGLAHGERAQSPTALQFYGITLFGVCRMRGGMEALAPSFEDMVEMYPTIPTWRAGLAYLHAETGAFDDARQIFKDIEAAGFDLPFDSNWNVGMALLCMTAWLLAEPVAAEKLYGILHPHADTIMCAGMPCEVLGPAHYALGLASATMAHWDDAESHMATALAWLDRAGGHTWLARGKYDVALILRKRGDQNDEARIRELFADARSTSVERGFPRLVEMIDAAESQAL